MTDATYTLAAPATTAADGGTVTVRANASSSRERTPRRMPASIPHDQIFYWTFRWQESEARAERDVAEGRFRDFDNPTDAVRHLLDGDR